jgi:hypothetical protein
MKRIKEKREVESARRRRRAAAMVAKARRGGGVWPTAASVATMHSNLDSTPRRTARRWVHESRDDGIAWAVGWRARVKRAVVLRFCSDKRRS